MKLYFGNPFHLTAGAGVPGASNGAKSKGAVMCVSGRFVFSCPNCWAKSRRSATGLTRSGHGAERVGVGHGPELGPARVGRCGQQLALAQSRIEIGEGLDDAGRDATGNVDRLELVRMIE